MKAILSALALIIIVVLLTLTYYGLFAKVTIVEQEVGDFWLLYEKHVGDYKDVGPVIDSIYSRLLGEDGIATSRGLESIMMIQKKLRRKT